MSLIELKLENLRCIQHAELKLHPRHNLIWGSNGSGKTSLLEAAFLLGRGRSFRTRNSERLIRHGQPQLVVFGRTDDPVPRALGVEVSRAGRTTARINATDASSLTELSQAFPVQIIDPGVHRLIEEGGHRRRRWLDWAVFHVEPRFADDWVRYTRAVKQRNAALKQRSQASAWDGEIARLGEQISISRQQLVERLMPAWRSMVTALSGLDVDLHYSRGWSQDSDLKQALADSRSRDEARGMTHVGPHRADVLPRLGGRAAREVLSRGQQKLVAIAMTLAQIRLLQDVTALTPTLLLDDPAAELDDAHLRGFIDEVNQLRCQLILTSLQRNADPFGAPDQVFHVEQGAVRPV